MLSDKMTSHPDFMRLSDIANEAIHKAMKDNGTPISTLPMNVIDRQLDRIVDDLTSALFRARRLKGMS